MATFLIGGGWSPGALPLIYGPFLDAAGSEPEIACVVLDEGDGVAQFERWRDALTSVAPCTPVPVLVAEGSTLDVASLGDADGVLVCGGLTPAYATALSPTASDLRAWLAIGPRPYAGFSAGAAIAATDALVGGWIVDGMPVCPGDAGEDLDEVSAVAGLGLAPFAIDVHAAQWGTLSRLIAAVHTGRVTSGFAIDEDTLFTLDGATATVGGLGRVHRASAAEGGVLVRSWSAGEVIELA